jgi:AraC-like DNA-binding protein
MAHLSLAALAFEAGYSDQSHMTREFRQLGGFMPGRRPSLPVINIPQSWPVYSRT